MTYRTLLKKLQEIPDARLDDDVVIFNASTDEYLPAICTEEASEKNDVLDEGHLIIVVES